MRRASRAMSRRTRSAFTTGSAGSRRRSHCARERPARFGEAEERPGALALPGGEPRLDQQSEMTRDARLRLAENGDQLAHREFGGFEQAENAQPGLLASRLEARKQSAKAERRRPFVRHKHIFMSILAACQARVTAGIDDLPCAKDSSVWNAALARRRLARSADGLASRSPRPWSEGSIRLIASQCVKIVLLGLYRHQIACKSSPEPYG